MGKRVPSPTVTSSTAVVLTATPGIEARTRQRGWSGTRRLGRPSPAITLGHYAHFMREAGSKGRTAWTDCWGGREIRVSAETAQILPRADGRRIPAVGRLPGRLWIETAMKWDGLRKC
ncbi:hypothetical protein GCM10010365_62540 [Streptomyces poonensis]|uniref:Uncharacterized protein n=1 Tax=Streptomyces poonensis TaxID=68255 RepID=A0A918Q4C0_9ACTN|nr:hypothetical protein GCM10010365_62540 [Streptomyces poonensis]GLJ93196.1 hypothetical protein GCM10017589_58080 [Streptomyces poonensis]